MSKLRQWFLSEESGQGMVEYGLILALIAIAAVALLAKMGGEVKTSFSNVNSELEKSITP